MKKSRNLCAVLILAVVLGALVIQTPVAYSAELSPSEKVLSFLTDVVKIDIPKYNVTPSDITVSYPSDLGGLAKVDGGYMLESDEGKTHIDYTYINNFLDYIHVYPIKGETFYVEKDSANLLACADAFLQRYQTYTGFSDLEEMRSVLKNVSELKDTTTTVGNIKLTIKTGTLNHTSFSWVYTYNGADYHTGMYLSFKDGSLYTFSDDRYNRIGSTVVNVSREQAIAIAKERAQNVSWKVDLHNGTVVEITNATVLDDHMGAQLLTSNREPLVMYPYWLVSLTFDRVYPGSVYGVTFSIWADTGEIFYGFLNMLGGSVTDDASQVSPGGNGASLSSSSQETRPPIATEMQPSSQGEPASTPSPTSTPTIQQMEPTMPMKSIYAIAAAVAAPMIVAASYIFYKRRK